MDELLKKVRDFNDRRGWRDKHSPLHLALSVAVEAGELLECFQWIPEGDVMRRLQDDQNFNDEVGMELADVMIYVLSLSDRCQVDLRQAVLTKLALNEERFPPKD